MPCVNCHILTTGTARVTSLGISFIKMSFDLLAVKRAISRVVSFGAKSSCRMFFGVDQFKRQKLFKARAHIQA